MKLFKIILATKYVLAFNKAVKLASNKLYEDAYVVLSKINSSKLKGRTLFQHKLLKSVILYGLQDYTNSRNLMEELYGSLSAMAEYNVYEKAYLEYYLILHYKNMEGFVSLSPDILDRKLSTSNINLNLVANNIKSVFPID